MEHRASGGNNGEGCRPRYDKDYMKLKEFAESLDADVIPHTAVILPTNSDIAVYRTFCDRLFYPTWRNAPAETIMFG